MEALLNKIIGLVGVDAHMIKDYVNFCVSNSTESREPCNRHHILPVASFPEFRSLAKNPWNCSRLSIRDHIVAHILLYKAWPTLTNARSIIFTLNVSRDKIIDVTDDMIDAYANSINKHTESLVGKPSARLGIMNSDETRAKISASNLGHKDTDETRAKKSESKKGKPNGLEGKPSPMKGRTNPNLSKALTGRKFSDEHRKNISKSQKGIKRTNTRTLTDGVEFKRWNVNPDKFSRSQEFYEKWILAGNPKFYRFSTLLGFDGNYMQALVPRFENGWVPIKDEYWIRWLTTINNKLGGNSVPTQLDSIQKTDV